MKKTNINIQKEEINLTHFDNDTIIYLFIYLFLSHPQYAEVPRSGIEPEPQQ